MSLDLFTTLFSRFFCMIVSVSNVKINFFDREQLIDNVCSEIKQHMFNLKSQNSPSSSSKRNEIFCDNR